MKLQYTKKTLNRTEFHMMIHLKTKNLFKGVNVIKSRGALGTGLTTAPVLEAGGKPSTWFPPEGLVELTGCARFMRRPSNDFLLKNVKFSKISKNIIFLKFHEKLPVTFNLTLIEQIRKLLAPQP